MMYIIEYWTAGKWSYIRRDNGMPFMFTRKAEAQIALRSVNDAVPGRYRITLVRD